MLHENFPRLLDRILLAFLKDYNVPKSLDELKPTVFIDILGEGYSLDNLEKNLEIFCKETFDYTDYIKYGLNFLQQEGLITYDSSKRDDEKSVIITSKGFFKIKTESFSDKIENYKQIKKLQKNTLKVAIFSLVVSIISVIVTALLSSQYNDDNLNNIPSKTYENQTYKQLYKPTNDGHKP